MNNLNYSNTTQPNLGVYNNMHLKLFYFLSLTFLLPYHSVINWSSNIRSYVIPIEIDKFSFYNNFVLPTMPTENVRLAYTICKLQTWL